jgi:hypothetical protein
MYASNIRLELQMEIEQRYVVSYLYLIFIDELHSLEFFFEVAESEERHSTMLGEYGRCSTQMEPKSSIFLTDVLALCALALAMCKWAAAPRNA